MPSDRIQRRIEAFLDQAEEASDANDWALVADKARAVLAIDEANDDALAFLSMAVANGVPESVARSEDPVRGEQPTTPVRRVSSGDFVGREQEMQRLREALDQAAASGGSIVMISGEAGIGKTRSVRELEQVARAEGIGVLWGRSHESEGAPPFWPWQQIGSAYIASVPEQQLLEDVRENAQPLQVLLPSISELLPHLPPPDSDTPDAEFQLFLAAANFLKHAAQRNTLLLVFDDLQWADKSTLRLLQHVVPELPGSRILIVGTYRDTEVDRTHPLSEALASMNRTEALTRLSLSGLSEHDVEQYLEETGHVQAAPDFVRRVRAETDGNPFFLHEVVQQLAETTGRRTEAQFELVIPDGVKEALGRRLDRLDRETIDLLHVAAVLGREFSLAQLRLLVKIADDTLITRIDEALRANVIEELPAPGHYQFVHALMLDTLLDELSSTRRARLHGEIAEALERDLGDGAEDQGHLLAPHYIESAALNRSHVPKAVRYSQLAGIQARANVAWAVAADHFTRAVDIQDRLGDEAPSPELLHNLGSSLRLAGEAAEAGRILDRAFDAARASGDAIRMCEVALEAVGFDTVLAPDRHIEMLEVAIEALGDSNVQLRARLLARRAWEALPDDDASRAAAAEARSIAEDLDLPDVLVELAERDVHGLMDAEEYERCQEVAYRSFEAAQQAGRSDIAAHMLIDRAGTRLILGEIDRACDMAEEALAYASANRQPSWAGAARRILACRVYLRGEFERVDEAVARIPTDIGWGPPDLLRAKTAATLGNTDQALEILDQFESRYPLASAGALWPAYYFGLRANIALQAGRESDALRSLERCTGLLQEIPEPTYWRIAVSEAPDVLPRLGDEALVTTTYRRLAASRATATFVGAPFDVFRGSLAVRLELDGEAEAHFQAGLEWSQRERCPIEAGRCHQGLAEVARLRGDLNSVLEQLEAAAEVFSSHGARLYVDQVAATRRAVGA